MTPAQTQDLWQRILARCVRGESAPKANSRVLTQPCLRWSGNVANGHGRLVLRVHEAAAFGRREASVHLIVWWVTHGERAKFVDRLCGDTCCVEPEHLEARTPETNFWRHVDRVSDPDGCWPWKGGTHTFGYGSTANGSAHRVAYQFAKGEIPPGHVIRHQCHNPICCRPDHLLTGTQKENVHDSIRAGRKNTPRGEQAGNAKLTNVQAAALREIYADLKMSGNRALRLLATIVDMTPRNVWRVVTQRGYANAPAMLDDDVDSAVDAASDDAVDAASDDAVDAASAAASTAPAPVDLASYPVEAWSTWSAERQETELDRLVAYHRKMGFPWSVLAARREPSPLESVRRSRITIKDAVITAVGFAGQRTCTSLHLHRYRANYRGQPSVVEAFEDDKLLRRAIAYQLKSGDPVIPHRVIKAIAAIQRGPLNFPPTLARWLVDEYAPMEGTVLDPCSGYGGRLLGAVASTRHVRYIGADIEPASVLANQKLAEVLGVSDRVTQLERAVEDPRPWARADLVLLGPPYYDREIYGAAAAASLAQYPSYHVWCQKFLATLLDKALTAAPRVMLNLGVLRDGGATYDLPSDAIEIAQGLGARVERNFTWVLSKFGQRSRQEQIIILVR